MTDRTPPGGNLQRAEDRRRETERALREQQRPLSSLIETFRVSGRSGESDDGPLAPGFDPTFAYSTALFISATPPEWARQAVVQAIGTVSVYGSGGANVLQLGIRTRIGLDVGLSMGVGFDSLSASDSFWIGGSAPYYGLIDLDGSDLLIETEARAFIGSLSAGNGAGFDLSALITWNR